MSKTPEDTKKTPFLPSTDKKPAKKAAAKKPPTKKATKAPEYKEPKSIEEETRDAIAIGDIEYTTDKKGVVTVSHKVEKVKGMFPNPLGTTPKYKPEYANMIIDFFYKYVQEVYLDREYYGRNDGGDFMGRDRDGLKRGMVKRETHKLLGSVYPTLERFASQL